MRSAASSRPALGSRAYAGANAVGESGVCGEKHALEIAQCGQIRILQPSVWVRMHVHQLQGEVGESV